MNAPEQIRALHPPLRLGAWDRFVARIFHRVLDRIDAGLEAGAIEADLPDGTHRILGGRNPGPVCEVRLNRWRALVRLGRSGSVGWYEGWAAGDWSSPDPVPLFDLFMRNRVALGQSARAKGLSRIAKRIRHALRGNHIGGARRNIVAHYDLGNNFYAAWLDPTMSYSSAMFEPGDDLGAAQRRKMDAVADRLCLETGTSVLEIGCGWGSLAKALAAKGADVTAITLSPSQFDHAKKRAPDVAFRLQDYREVSGRYDAIASIEMVEAVGEQYWPAYLDTVARCLKPGGRAAIQFISIADDIFEQYRESADFIQTFVFPGGMLLSESRFRALAVGRGLAWTAQHDFGIDYAETLRLWRERFDAAVDEGRLPRQFDQRFVALWRYYLMYCEGGFRGGGIQVSQVTLIKGEGDEAIVDAGAADRRSASSGQGTETVRN